MKNEIKLSYLIAKSESDETLNWLDELLSCETFSSDEQAGQVDSIMKQLGDMDDDTASAIADLLLAVASEQEIAQCCDVGNWPSLTGLEQIEIPCLIEKAELNQVEQFIQKFVTKAEMEEDELGVIDSALETISALDDASLSALHSLFKIEFSETTIKKLWPSLFKQESSAADGLDDSPESKKKSGLKWPTISGQL